MVQVRERSGPVKVLTGSFCAPAWEIERYAAAGTSPPSMAVTVEVLPGRCGVECKHKYPFDSAPEAS